MKSISKLIILTLLVTFVLAQSPEPPLSDSRLTVHTLLREDIFAGFLANDTERFERGEKNIQTLLEKRPAEKADLLAWKGGATLYRAVRAHEEKHQAEFQQKYKQALDLFADARRTNSNNSGAAAVIGGSYVIFADRLPKDLRADAWAQAYDAYQLLWKQQSPIFEKLPMHLRGELLSGLMMSAQRTGREQEATQYLDKLLAVMKDTPYETAAKKWKDNPQVIANSSITCLNCHEAGRLAARLAKLKSK